MMRRTNIGCVLLVVWAEWKAYELWWPIKDRFLGSALSPPPSSFGVDLTRLCEPRFFCPFGEMSG